MNIVLNRKAGVPIREQITAQIELQILSGECDAGRRLPSTRALARRLKIHSNTVSAAYRILEERGLVELRRGSGVFVCRPGPRGLGDAHNLDEMIRLGLRAALERYSGTEVRAAVLRWLSGAPPRRLLAIDPSPETGALLARELSDALGLPARACSLAELERQPGRLSGALGVALPYHVEAVRERFPGAAVEGVTLEVPPEGRRAILELPRGAIVLLVSRSPDVLRLGAVLAKSLRGAEILFEGRLLGATREWRRLLPAADFVFADALAFPEVADARRERVGEVRLLPESSLVRLRSVLSIVVPAPADHSEP